MGTNFYLHTKDKKVATKWAPYTVSLTDFPDFGYRIHIGKTSYGWLPVFQAHEDTIESIADYKKAYDTGNFKIYDEYGTEYNWEEFTERVLEFSKDREDPLGHENSPDFFKKDKDGYEFVTGDFC